MLHALKKSHKNFHANKINLIFLWNGNKGETKLKSRRKTLKILNPFHLRNSSENEKHDDMD